MFLKQVYKYHGLLFILMIVFIMMQLLVNFRQGTVITPFFHYGMYSAKANIKPKYAVVEIYVDGQPLHLLNYTPRQVDKILQPVYAWNQRNCTAQFYHGTIERLAGKVGIPTNKHKFIPNITRQEFIDWYKPYLERIIDREVDEVSLRQSNYSLLDGRLVKTDSTSPVSPCY